MLSAMVPQKGFNPETKKYSEHVGSVTWIQSCFLVPLPSPGLFCSVGTLLAQHLPWPGMVWGLRPAPRSGGKGKDGKEKNGTFISLWFFAGLWVWTDSGLEQCRKRRGQWGNCGLQGNPGRKQNSGTAEKKTVFYWDAPARACRLVLEASSCMISIPRNERNRYLCMPNTLSLSRLR